MYTESQKMIDCTKWFVLGNAGCLYIKLHTNTQNKTKEAWYSNYSQLPFSHLLSCSNPPPPTPVPLHRPFTVIMASCGFCHFSLSGSTVVTDRLIGPCLAKALNHVMDLWTGGRRIMSGQRGNLICEGKRVLLCMGWFSVPCFPSLNGRFVLSPCLFVVLFNSATPLL
jgi:hypothetical protein